MKKEKSTIRDFVANGIVAALYLAVTIILTPVAQGPIQFRISESLNHLVVFQRKFRWGIVSGVILYNILFSEFGIVDVFFGGLQTYLALTATVWIKDHYPHMKISRLLVYNTFFFTISMALIAYMLHIMIELPFWLTYGTTALSELIVMSISAPVMYYLNKRIDFARLFRTKDS